MKTRGIGGAIQVVGVEHGNGHLGLRKVLIPLVDHRLLEAGIHNQ